MGVYVPALTYTAAVSLDDALASLGERPGARLLAGGHDLVPDMKAGRTSPPLLVDLRKVPGLREVSVDHATGKVRIGAMATLNQLAGDMELGGQLRALDEAIGSVGDAQVRNCTTVGGTLASRHPAADLAAVALALEAEVHTTRPAGPWTISAEDLLSGPATPLDPVEIITGVEIANPADVGQRLREAEEPRQPVSRRCGGGAGGADQQLRRCPVPGGGHRRVRTPDPPT